MEMKPEKDGKQMLEIAEAYIRGDVIQDKVAAEAWLERVIALEDTTSVLAMGILGREILGKAVLSDADYRDICREYQTADANRRRELEQLLSFGTREQRDMLVNSLQL